MPDASLTVPTYSAAQVRAAEAPLLERGAPLMARASRALAGVVAAERSDSRRTLVLAGSGDNGGDALFAAAQLARTTVVDFVTVSERFNAAGLEAALGASSRSTYRAV